jgi:hypothetical protein
MTLCICGHEAAKYQIDLEPETENLGMLCMTDGCTCPDFEPNEQGDKEDCDDAM